MIVDGRPAHMSARKPLGFAIPGYAAAAGKKGHALGVSRQWTAEEARRASMKGAARRLAALSKRGPMPRDAAGRFIPADKP